MLQPSFDPPSLAGGVRARSIFSRAAERACDRASAPPGLPVAANPIGTNGRITSNASLAASLSAVTARSEEHTSELQSLMRISYAVFCLKKKKQELLMQHKDRTY